MDTYKDITDMDKDMDMGMDTDKGMNMDRHTHGQRAWTWFCATDHSADFGYVGWGSSTRNQLLRYGHCVEFGYALLVTAQKQV
jgi:hypothetical protein